MATYGQQNHKEQSKDKYYIQISRHYYPLTRPLSMVSLGYLYVGLIEREIHVTWLNPDDLRLLRGRAGFPSRSGYFYAFSCCNTAMSPVQTSVCP